MPLTKPWTFPPRPLGQIRPFREALPTTVMIGNPPYRPPSLTGSVQIDGVSLVVATNETYTGLDIGSDVQIDGISVVVITNQTYP